MARPDGRPREEGRRLRHPDRSRPWSPAAGRQRRSKRASPTTAYAASVTCPPRCAKPVDAASGRTALRELGWRQQSSDEGLSGRAAAVPLPDPARRRRPATLRGRRAQGHEPAVAPQHQEGRKGGGRGHLSRPVPTTSRPSTTSTCTPPSATTSRRGPLAYFRTMVEALSAGAPTGSHCRSPATRATWWPARSRSGSAPTTGTPTAPPRREARRARVERDPVGDDPRCAGGGRRGLRPARHHRHARPRGLPRGA